MVNKLDRMVRRHSRLEKIKRKDVHGMDIPGRDTQSALIPHGKVVTNLLLLV